MKIIKLSQKQRKIIYTILLLIIFLSYFDAVMDMTLFKYVPITQIFSADRYRVNSLNLIPFADWNVDRGGMFRDILLNVLLFFPFGFLIQMRLRKSKIRWVSILIPFVCSVVIEVLQYVLQLGVSDVTDIISNTFGAFLGACAYRLFHIIFKRNQAKANKVLLVLLLLIAFINFCLSL